MRVRLFILAVGGIVAAAILVGIFVAGSPMQAQREAFDRARLDDLGFIATALQCANPRIREPVLPDALTLESLRGYCGGVAVSGPELVDNETGEPHVYTRVSETEFRICAEFDDAERAMRLNYSMYQPGGMFSFDPGTGCVTGRIR